MNQRLDTTMTEAFHAIWEVHEQKKVPLRTAAFIKALQRVTRVRFAAISVIYVAVYVVQ